MLSLGRMRARRFRGQTKQCAHQQNMDGGAWLKSGRSLNSRRGEYQACTGSRPQATPVLPIDVFGILRNPTILDVNSKPLSRLDLPSNADSRNWLLALARRAVRDVK